MVAFRGEILFFGGWVEFVNVVVQLADHQSAPQPQRSSPQMCGEERRVIMTTQNGCEADQVTTGNNVENQVVQI